VKIRQFHCTAFYKIMYWRIRSLIWGPQMEMNTVLK